MTQTIGSASIESLCVSVMSGGTPSRRRDDYWTNGTIPWIKTGELKDCRIYDAEEKITEEGLAGSSAKIFPINTVLMAMYGDGKTITSLGILENELASNQACCAMIADPAQCDYQYLYYALMHHRHKLLGLVVAGAQRNLSIGIIKRFQITTFSLGTQQRIASILSAYDNLIENNRRRIQLLEQAARLLYKEWFVHLRFPGHEHVKIKNGIPEGWRKKPLGDVAPLKYGKALKKDDRTPGPFSVYGSSGVVGTHSKALVEGPAIIVGRKGNVGSVYWSSSNFFPIDTVYFIEAEKCSFYLYHALLNIQFISTDVAVPGLNRNYAHSRGILIPDNKILSLFEEHTKSMQDQIDNLKRYNLSLSKARDLLLPRLMNGEVAA